MKNRIVFLLLFIFLSLLPVKKVQALMPIQIDKDIRLVVTIIPTATPTLASFKPIDRNIDIKLISTVVPTNPPVVVTRVVTPTEMVTQTTEPKLIETEKEEIPEKKIDLKLWFMNITLGLLVLIIIIQVWPKKKKEDK